MQKLVQLANSNCPWCLNDMVDRLRARPGVRRAELDTAAGCLRVDYDETAVADLIAGVRGDLRAWEQARDGEVVMVEVDAHPVASCPYRPPHGAVEPGSSPVPLDRDRSGQPYGQAGREDGAIPKVVRAVSRPVGKSSARRRSVFEPLVWLWRRIRA